MDEGYADEVKEAMETACQDGQSAGAEGEAFKALRQAVVNNPAIMIADENGKFSNDNFDWDRPVIVVATIKEIMQFIHDPDDMEAHHYEFDHDILEEIGHKFSVRQPHYGFQGFDDDVALERFIDAVWEFLPEEN
jgi:hypothetical protein